MAPQNANDTTYCTASMSLALGCSCAAVLMPVLLAAGVQPAPAAGGALVVGCACGAVLVSLALNAMLQSLARQSDSRP
jgi:hypothetical protein